MTGKVFINYRRGDDPGTTGRLYDRLEAEFSAGQLFMDVEGHIKGGDDFVDVLRAQVAQCDLLLAIIGPRWLEIADEQGRRRLDNPEDWVRVEIAGALQDSKRVIPVLVGGADIPRADDLPDDMKPLARRQVIRITLERFKADAQGLVSQIKAALAEIEARRHAETEAERQAAAEAEAKRQADEAARTAERERQEAERARQQALAGLSPEAIRQMLEVENWAFVKDKDDPAELRDHIARFGGGETERFAAARLASLEWAALGPEPDKDVLEDFLDEFSEAPEASEAQAALDKITAAEAAERAAAQRRARETEAWGNVAASADKAEIEAFLTDWPDGQHAASAKARLQELRGAGGFSRRAVLKGVGYGVGGSVAAGGVGLAAVVPGAPLWRLIHDQSTRTFTDHSSSVYSVAFAPDGRTALSGGSGGTLRLWDVTTGNNLRTFTGHSSSVYSVAFAPDGRTALSGSLDGTLRLWDVTTGKTSRTFNGHNSYVTSFAVAPDGRSALLGSENTTFLLWDLTSGKALRTFTGHKDWVNSVAIAPDGKTALSASGDTTLKLWDLASGKALRTFTGHKDWVNSVAIAPDSQTAISGCKDKTLKLWYLATGQALGTFTGHTRSVWEVAIAPDGRAALSAGGHDKTLKLWDLTPYLPR